MRPYSATLTCRAFLLIISQLVFIICCTSSAVMAAKPTEQGQTQTIRPESTAELQIYFKALGYDWMQLEHGVPPLILKNIPTDINNSRTTTKKRIFFMGLLPMVLLANQEIVEEREEILQILQRHETRESDANAQRRLEALSKRYGLRGHPLVDRRARTRILERVDTIPASLVLAQAANESAWGTSRFARLGNNIFGEWTYKAGTGIVPVGRPPGETYEVREFSSLYESIRSYMNNLNRNRAYHKLRKVRADLRKSGQPVTGLALAEGLLKYSQRGEAYIEEIQAMIRQNKLGRTEMASIRHSKNKSFASTNTSGNGFFSTRNRSIARLTAARSNP